MYLIPYAAVVEAMQVKAIQRLLKKHFGGDTRQLLAVICRNARKFLSPEDANIIRQIWRK